MKSSTFLSSLLAVFFLIGCTSLKVPTQSITETLQPQNTNLPSTPTIEISNTAQVSEIDDNVIFIDDVDLFVEFKWLSENSFRYTQNQTTEGNYQIYHYQEVSLSEKSELINELSYDEKEPNPLSADLAFNNISPSGQFILLETKTNEPTGPLHLDQSVTTYHDDYYQTTIYSDQKTISPIISSPLQYINTWVPDEKHILLIGTNTDMGGRGIHLVNLETQEVTTLSDDYALSEYSYGWLISPDSRYLLIMGKAIPLDGSSSITICQTDEWHGDQFLTDDGQFLYVFCESENEEKQGILRKLNLNTGEVESNLLDSDIVIKPIYFKVSPDQKWLLFESGTSIMNNKEDHGLYLVRLNNKDQE